VWLTRKRHENVVNETTLMVPTKRFRCFNETTLIFGCRNKTTLKLFWILYWFVHVQYKTVMLAIYLIFVFFSVGYFTKEPQDTLIYSGSSATISLQCETDSIDTIFSWRKNNAALEIVSAGNITNISIKITSYQRTQRNGRGSE